MVNADFKIPKSLKDALKAGRVVPFVGAGASMSVKKKNDDDTESSQSLFPSWKGFVEILAQTLRNENKPEEADYVLSSIKIKKPKYLEAMQHAQGELGKNLWYQLFDKNFDKLKNEASESSLKLNRLIWELGNKLIITTNVDRVFQWTCPQTSEFKLLDVQNVEYAQLQNEEIPKRPTVWYLHGHVDHKEKVIFTLDQYKAFYDQRNNEAKLQALITLLTQRTLLFIGFSLDDAYIREQLEYIHNIYKGGADSFYVLLRESEIPTANLPEYVTPIPFSDFGKPLEDLIEELALMAKGDDDSDDANPPQLPDLSPVRELLTTASSPRSVTFSFSQKLFKSTLGEKHFNVPFASKGEGFVGRVGKLDEIWNALNSGKRAAIGQAVAIAGFGGLGKTQLAVEYAHHFRDRYETGVFWLTADEDMSVQLIKIGENLHWISSSDTGFDQAELVRNRFRKLSDCLIIFDNVDDQQAIKDYLPEIDYHPHILVTSREEQHGFHPVNLDTLTEAEARELLIQIADRSPESEAEEKALENILKELDGLPLAVELVGGYLLRRKATSFQDYFEYLEKEPIDRIEGKFLNNPFTKRDKSIIRALKISETLLNDTEYLEEILDILAWSGKSSMGYSLLQELVGTDDNLALKDGLGVALELHFIKKEENEERYAIHRLLAKVRRYEKPLEQYKVWHKKIVKGLEKWFEAREDEFHSLSEFEAEFDHLLEWKNLTLEHIPFLACYLMVLSASPNWQRGSYQEALKLHFDALCLYEKEQINNNVLLAIIYNGIGVINNDLGNTEEALKYLFDALRIRQKFPNNEHKDLANTLDNIGTTYHLIGKYNKALEFERQALEMRQNLFGDKAPDIATSLNNIGLTYSSLEDHQEALNYKQLALEMQNELYSDKHPHIATSLANLGLTYNELNDKQEALKLVQQALKMQYELFGEKHPNIANSLTNLGSIYRDLGDYSEALNFEHQALEMECELFGEKHYSIAATLNNLGSTYAFLNNHQKAVECYDKSLQMTRDIFGNHHPNTFIACSNLIKKLLEIGFNEKAGRLAGEFLSYVPQNHPMRMFFEKHGTVYRKAKKRNKKRRR